MFISGGSCSPARDAVSSIVAPRSVNEHQSAIGELDYIFDHRSSSCPLFMVELGSSSNFGKEELKRVGLEGNRVLGLECYLSFILCTSWVPAVSISLGFLV